MSLFLIGMNLLANNQLALTKLEDVKSWLYCIWLSNKMTSIVLDYIDHKLAQLHRDSWEKMVGNFTGFAKNWR